MPDVDLRRWPRRASLGAAASMLAAGLAACSFSVHAGPSPAPPAAGPQVPWSRAADAACTQEISGTGAVMAQVGASYDLNSPAAAVGLAAGRADLVSQEIAALHAVKPPASQAGAFDEFTGQLKKSLQALQSEQSASVAGNTSAYNSALHQQQAADLQAVHLAGDMDLPACAQHGLSGADVAAAERVATYAAKVNDPAICVGSDTPAYVLEVFGSLDKCRSDMSKPVPQAEQVAGVSYGGATGAGDFADLSSTFHGGTLDGTRWQVFLLRQNGQWQLLYLQRK